MGNKGWLILLLLVAVGAVIWLLDVPALFTSSDPGEPTGGPGVADPSSLRTEGGRAGAGPDAAQPATKGPVLFGRARELLVGVGGLAGRVLDFQSGEAVAKAHVVLTGSGFGDEPVSAQLEADEHGRFHFTQVPAGDGYTLHVSDGGKRTRTLSALAVDADQLRDLGTVWLGERGVLEGVVLDDAGRGVEGAAVQVHGGGNLFALLENLTDLMQNMDRDARPLAEVRSGKGGLFRIPGVDPGPINVVVRAAGFQQKMVAGVMTSQGAAAGTLTIRLQRGGAIVGVVVDERDRGIEGARVACIDKNDFSSAFFGRQFSLTDEEGRFRIESPPGLAGFAVIVAAEGYPTLMTEGKAGVEEHRFVLVGGAQAVLRVVADDTGRPVEGARLMAMFGEKDTPGASMMTYASGLTDDRGEAVVMARPGKLQMLFLNHAERGTAMYSPSMPKGVGGGTLTGPEDVTIKPPRTTLVFRLKRGITLVGRVTDPDGNPIAGARCRAMGNMGFGGSALTDADGRYALPGQTALIAAVFVTAPGWVQRNPTGGMGGKTPEPDARGEVTIDVVMERAATVTGRVLGPDSRPLAGVRVKLAGEQAVAMVAAATGGGAEGITNGAGRYVIDGVHSGEKMFVLARLGGYLDGHSERFAVVSGAPVQAPDVTLARGARLTVTVEDPAGEALPGARVEVALDGRRMDALWDPMSNFRSFADQVTGDDATTVIEDLPDGQVTLTASKRGFAPQRLTLTLERKTSAEPTTVLRLREAVAIRGRILDGEGKPVAGAGVGTQAVGAEEESGWVPMVTAQSGAQGRFVLEGLPDVPVTLQVHAEGYRRGAVTVEDARIEAEVRLVKIAADAQKRLAEIQKELMEIYGKFASVKDEAERKALAQRMAELQREQGKLQGQGESVEATDR